MINAIGLANVGVERLRARRSCRSSRAAAPRWSSTSSRDRRRVRRVRRGARRARRRRTRSSSTSPAPTSRRADVEFGTDPVGRSRELVGVPRGHQEAAHRQAHAQLADIVRASPRGQEAGADALSVINTIRAHGHRRAQAPAAPRPTTSAGSPARRSSRSRCAWCWESIARCPEVPIIGIGGIASARTRRVPARRRHDRAGRARRASPSPTPRARRILGELLHFMRGGVDLWTCASWSARSKAAADLVGCPPRNDAQVEVGQDKSSVDGRSGWIGRAASRGGGAFASAGAVRDGDADGAHGDGAVRHQVGRGAAGVDKGVKFAVLTGDPASQASTSCA